MRRPALGPLPLALLLSLCASACKSYDGRPVEWEYISPVILQPNCATASCHSRGAAVAGLDFSDADRGYVSLTRLRYQIVDRYATGETCSPSHETVICRGGYRPLVMPYNPQQSRLLHILRKTTPPRMPPDRPLFEEDIKLIEGWILIGAPRHRNGPPAMALPDAATGDAAAEAGAGDGGTDGGPTDGGAPSDARDALPDRTPEDAGALPTSIPAVVERG
jgi:hypothetical protein